MNIEDSIGFKDKHFWLRETPTICFKHNIISKTLAKIMKIEPDNSDYDEREIYETIMDI